MSYIDYFLNSSSGVVELECLEISHPSFSKTYYIVRNAIDGITVTHEDASVHTYEYYPLQLRATGAADDLDQVLDIQLGDTGDVVPAELDLIAIAGTFATKPICIFRTYRSDDLSAPLNGPQKFVIDSFASKKEGQQFSAAAPKLNRTATGEIYSVARFPMIKGFL